jgi:hypothetical protein
MASSSAPRRGRASVTFGLTRLKSCPQGPAQLPMVSLFRVPNNNGLLSPHVGAWVPLETQRGRGVDCPPVPLEASRQVNAQRFRLPGEVEWDRGDDDSLVGDQGGAQAGGDAAVQDPLPAPGDDDLGYHERKGHIGALAV